MKTQTKQKILKFIQKSNMTRPHDLAIEFNISKVMIHRHLTKLVSDQSIKKIGTPPQVYYVATSKINKLPPIIKMNPNLTQIIKKNWFYINPDGIILTGLNGFFSWAEISGQTQNLLQLAKEYANIRKNADKLFNPSNLIEGLDKINKTFDNVSLDKLLYQDFYSLPKFGKTKLGNLVLQAKQTQSIKLITKLAKIVEPTLHKIIKQYQIEAIGYIPHSIKRVTPFLPALKQNMNINLPHIDLNKAYAGDIPIAQKTLKKLKERIINAKNTIFIHSSPNFPKRILLIDDAVGSGATLNETAKKLKKYFKTDFVVGFSIVGSLKGFPVIIEV